MWVVRARIDFKFFEHCFSQLGFWQHTPNGRLNEALGVLLSDFGCKFFAKTAEIAAMAPVEFLVLFSASHPDSGGINDDDVVSGIEKWCVSWSMFPLQ